MTEQPEQAEAPAPPDETVRWIYGGRRVSAKGKVFHAWYDADSPPRLDLTDTPHAFVKVKGSIVGGIYTVAVAGRDDDGDVVSVRPDPTYTGDRVDDLEFRAALEAAQFAADMEVAQGRMERRHAADSALEEALGPLVVISGQMRTRAERAAFTQYVVRRLGSGWS